MEINNIQFKLTKNPNSERSQNIKVSISQITNNTYLNLILFITVLVAV